MCVDGTTLCVPCFSRSTRQFNLHATVHVDVLLSGPLDTTVGVQTTVSWCVKHFPSIGIVTIQYIWYAGRRGGLRALMQAGVVTSVEELEQALRSEQPHIEIQEHLSLTWAWRSMPCP